MAQPQPWAKNWSNCSVEVSRFVLAGDGFLDLFLSFTQMMLFRRQATDTVSEGERKVGSEWGGDKKTDEWSGCNDEGSISGTEQSKESRGS